MIVLLTDFGWSDPYVGQIKGALLSRVPECRVIDLTHDVPPYGLTQASFFLDASFSFFSEGTIFLSVVDPGVGGGRRIIALEALGHLFLAPDNGLLSLILERGQGTGMRAFSFRNPIELNICPTFHGRDLFAPLAAQLLSGDSPESLAYEIDPGDLVRHDWCAPVESEGSLHAHVLHTDRFGNVISNMRIQVWSERMDAPLHVRTHTARLPLQRASTYCEIEPGQLGLIAGSQGFFELAMNMGSAADMLSLRPGDGFSLHFSDA